MKTGKLYSYVGPMFCGKTERLLSLIEREIFAKKANPQREFLAINSAEDTRFGTHALRSHSGKKYSAHFLFTSKDIMSVYESALKEKGHIQSVFIDEAMFFDSGLVSVLKDILSKGTNTHLSFLDLTSEGNPFPFKDGVDHVGTLLAMSYSVEKLRSICVNTGEEATMTHYLKGQKGSHKIGGAKDYIPVSFDEWIRLRNH